MKITDKTIELILMLLIIVSAALTYRFGYLEYTNRTEQLKQDNKVLAEEIRNLEARVANKEKLEEGTMSAAEMLDALVDTYGSGTKPEKTLVMITELEKETGATFSSLSFNDEAPYFETKEKDNSGKPIVSVTKSYLSMSYSVSYDGMKKLMDFVNNYPEHMTVEEVSSTYNAETGLLTGSLRIAMYNAYSENSREYEEPQINGIDIGKDNIFE